MLTLLYIIFRPKQQLHKHVLAHTAQFWAKSFISELILNVGTWDQSAPTPFLNQGLIIDKYNSSKKRLLMFDYDVSFIQVPRMLSFAVRLNGNTNTHIVRSSTIYFPSWLGHINTYS